MMIIKGPLTGAFNITSALMLHYGFKNILYESINNDTYIDGLFYFKDEDPERLDSFVNLIKSAQLSGLIHEFDDICLTLDRIIIRKWNSPNDIVEQKPEEDTI